MNFLQAYSALTCLLASHDRRFFFLFTVRREGSRVTQGRHVVCHSIDTPKPHDFELDALRASQPIITQAHVLLQALDYPSL